MREKIPGYQDFLGLIAGTLTLLLLKTGSFLTTKNFAGRDLVGAYSLVKTFKFGWTDMWFLGLPMFKFYPPGFFGFTNALGGLIGDLIAFKAVVYLSLVLFPAVAYYSFREIFDRKTGLVAGFLGIFLVFLRSPFSLIYQTLQVGLTAQNFALVMFILFAGLIWKKDRGSSYLASVLLGLTVVSHPFIGFMAVIYLGVYFLLTANLFRTTMASAGLGLAAWWVLPLLENLWYAQKYIGPTGKFSNLPWLFLPFLALERSRKTLSFILLGGIMLMIGLVDLGPFQHYRYFSYAQITLVLAASPGIKRALEAAGDYLPEEKLFYLLAFSIIFASLTANIQADWRAETDLTGVTPEKDRLIAETSHDQLHESYVPIQTIPLETDSSVVNGLYADSSISSPYLLGLEKAAAQEPVPNPIAVNANLSTQQLEARMDYFGISYALTRSSEMRENLHFMSERSSNNQFSLLYHNASFNRTVDNVITVSGPRTRWRKLNEHIFRNELRTNIVYLHNQRGDYDLKEHSIEEILRIAENSDTNRTIRIGTGSITPKMEKEAVFGLRADFK